MPRKSAYPKLRVKPEPKTKDEITTRIQELQQSMRGGSLNGAIKTEIIRLQKKLEKLK
jgi:hypothetical protein